MIILPGNSNHDLAIKLTKIIKAKIILPEISEFPNGETRLFIPESVVNQEIVIVQSLQRPVDRHFVELLLLIDAAHEAGAKNISLVLPWFGYSLQDKPFRAGEPVSAKVIAQCLSKLPLSHIWMCDLHNSAIKSFFETSTSELSTLELFAKHIESLNLSKPVVVSPDAGGLKRATHLSQKLGTELYYFDKRRDRQTAQVVSMELTGEVTDKDVILLDDIINTGQTVATGVKKLRELGAKSITFCATHGLFAADARSKLLTSGLDHLVVTNTIPQQPEQRLVVLDVAPLFAAAIIGKNL